MLQSVIYETVQALYRVYDIQVHSLLSYQTAIM